MRRQSDGLDLDILDLVEAKAAFEVEGSGLSQTQFVQKFCSLVGECKAIQLSYLFMKIDCNSDGQVTWDEFLSYVMLQDKTKSQPLKEELSRSEFAPQETTELHFGHMHREPISRIMYIPKCQCYVSASQDSTIRVWSGGQQLKPVTLIPISDRVGTGINDLATLPDALGKLAVASADRVISFFELNDHAGTQRWGLHGKMSLVDMPLSLCSWTLPDGTMCLAIGTDSGVVHFYDAKRLMSLVRHDDVVAQARGEREAKTISPAFTEPSNLCNLTLHTDWVSSIAYVDSMRGLLTASLDATVKITMLDWPAENDRPGEGTSRKIPRDASYTRSVLRCHHKGVMCVVTMQIGGRRMCASCGLEHNVYVCSLETGDVLKTLEGHKSCVVRLEVDPESSFLVSLAADGEIRTWDLATLVLVQTITPQDPHTGISAVCLNVQHCCMVTGSRRLVLWQQLRKSATSEQLTATMLAPLGHRAPLVAVLYSPQFYLVVSGDEGGLICVWDVRTGNALFRFEHQAKLTAMQFDCSGRRLITGAADGVVRLWNFSSGELMYEMGLDSHQGKRPGGGRGGDKRDHATQKSVSHRPPSPRGYLTADNSHTGREVTSVLHINQGAYQYFASVGWHREVRLSPDPSKVAKGTAGSSNAKEIQQTRRLTGHAEDILSVAFCPPNLLATSSYDGMIIIWNLQSGAVKSRLQPVPTNGSQGLLHSRAVECLCFLDGRARLKSELLVLASCGADGSLRFWNTRLGDCLFTVEGACSQGDSLQHMAVDETLTFLVTGDSSGRVKVWDMSHLSDLAALAPKGGATARADDPESKLQVLFTWRAHRQSIVHVEYLPGIDGVMTASTDCTARLWTLSGEQIGLFGQEKPWVLDRQETWLDRSRCIAGSDNEGKAAELNDEQVQALLPSSLRALPQARIGLLAEQSKHTTREPGRMSADELREVLRVLRQQRPLSTLHALDALSVKGDGSARDVYDAPPIGISKGIPHSGVIMSTSVLGSEKDVVARLSDVLSSATLPAIRSRQNIRHRKVFMPGTSSKHWTPDRSRPLPSPVLMSRSSSLSLPVKSSGP